MAQQSAGILLFRFIDGRLQLLLAHPGGPFWAHKDAGAWTIPKGLIEAGEDPLSCAKREFKEETGFDVEGDFIVLGRLKQPSGKVVYAWAQEQDVDVTRMVSNTFTLEWPRNSGQVTAFPEIDRLQWYDVAEAKIKITKGQVKFIEILVKKLQYVPPESI